MKNITKPISEANHDLSAIETIMQMYFEGLHAGDVTKLQLIFHEDIWLKSPGIRRSLAVWLKDVAERSSPEKLNKPFAFKILAIDIVQDQAMVKIHCPLFEFNYIDFLGLLYENGQWKIVTKMYTHLSQ